MAGTPRSEQSRIPTENGGFESQDAKTNNLRDCTVLLPRQALQKSNMQFRLNVLCFRSFATVSIATQKVRSGFIPPDACCVRAQGVGIRRCGPASTDVYQQAGWVGAT